MSSNPLNHEEMFSQLTKGIDEHRYNARTDLALRINSYSRLIASHPDNTHDNVSESIPSTGRLMELIDEAIARAQRGIKVSPLEVEAYTRIIVGRDRQPRNVMDY